ncbi:MAG: flotillin family protein, partial [Paracoccaceae bacterium]|nr:flotillin family protein [Paracoccaceae bacterium]
MSAIGWIIVLIVIGAALIALAAWFYQRATNEVALVKTGIGGRRVIIDGGTLALPYFHEITRVNMQTIRMTVARTGEAALITKDRLRVDVGADFYVSVTPQADAITRAAQTLGKRLFQPDQLRGLIDGMMIDALRSVAARMTMDELHENRAQFVREVRESLAEAMANYGLQLDSVSLTGLDQTPFSALDENNAFNAVGMRKLAEVIAKSKKERAEI